MSRPVEHDVLRTFPQRLLAERAQVLVALDDSEEVVAGELADDAREQAAAVRQQDLGLAEAARVEQDLAGRGVARVVLEADADVELAQRDPRRLAAPAHVDDLLLEREQLRERGARLRRALLLEARREGVRPGRDRQHGHAVLSSVVCSGVTGRPRGGATTRPPATTVVPRTIVRAIRPRRVRPRYGPC